MNSFVEEVSGVVKVDEAIVNDWIVGGEHPDG
jgi:hypothetical protein